ncbi:MAG: hypothetical protein M1825_006294 [Sarcosagium campestre]|nr:MAG: hypothetical protein M1825_006294 [Sarcosagium campestre]
MEAPGFLTLLYVMSTLPETIGIDKPLPLANWTMAGMFTVHYLYRAIIAPLILNPSMSPIHPMIWISAFSWQIINGLSLGGWLGGHGPTRPEDWAGRYVPMTLGMMIWAAGLMGNMFHDDELREIRRAALRSQAQREATDTIDSSKGQDGVVDNKKKKKQKSVDKVYQVPQNGLFEVILYPHYLCEWIEWIGFWMFAGLACLPARSFVFNEISTMTPRAVAGRRWYINRFGREKIGNRKAVVPGII